MAFASDSNRPQRLWHPPPSTCPTASGTPSAPASLLMHPMHCNSGGEGPFEPASQTPPPLTLPRKAPLPRSCTGLRALRIQDWLSVPQPLPLAPNCPPTALQSPVEGLNRLSDRQYPLLQPLSHPPFQPPTASRTALAGAHWGRKPRVWGRWSLNYCSGWSPPRRLVQRMWKAVAQVCASQWVGVREVVARGPGTTIMDPEVREPRRWGGGGGGGSPPSSGCLAPAANPLHPSNAGTPVRRLLQHLH